jgi:hypothetical protein
MSDWSSTHENQWRSRTMTDPLRQFAYASTHLHLIWWLVLNGELEIWDLTKNRLLGRTDAYVSVNVNVNLTDARLAEQREALRAELAKRDAKLDEERERPVRRHFGATRSSGAVGVPRGPASVLRRVHCGERASKRVRRTGCCRGPLR